MTWRLHRTAYMASLLGEQDGAESTAVAYTAAWNEFLRHVTAGTTLEDIPLVAAAYRAELRARGLAQNTVRNRLAAVRSYFRWCHSRRLIPENPLAYFKLPPEEPNQTPVIEEAVLWPVLEQLDSMPRNHRLVIALGTYAGLRASEIRRLRVRDVDFDAEVIHVIDSKGHKSRRVQLHRELAAILRREMPASDGCPNCHYGPDSYLCTSFKSSSGMMAKNAAWRVTDHYLSAGVHRLRTTKATYSLEHDVKLQTMADDMGHADPATTAKYYRGRPNSPDIERLKQVPFNMPPEQRQKAGHGILRWVAAIAAAAALPVLLDLVLVLPFGLDGVAVATAGLG